MIQGSIVAIVTPMHEDGSLDLPGLRKLIDWHIEEGTDGIVIVGTTGESPTVSVEEHCELVKLAGEHIDPALFPLAESYSPVEPIQQVAALLRFRADLHKELLPEMPDSAPVLRPTKEHP